ncbi:MAG: DinB family protein [Chloroflexota bacterium]
MSVLEEMQRTRSTLLNAIEGLDESALDRKGLIGDWSIKNCLAHLAGWEDWIAQVLQAGFANGHIPEHLRSVLQDFNAFNAEQVAEREELTPDEQLTELQRVRVALLEIVGHLDEATLNTPQPWAGKDRSIAFYLNILPHHDEEHLADIQAAAQKLRQ